MEQASGKCREKGLFIQSKYSEKFIYMSPNSNAVKFDPLIEPN